MARLIVALLALAWTSAVHAQTDADLDLPDADLDLPDPDEDAPETKKEEAATSSGPESVRDWLDRLPFEAGLRLDLRAGSRTVRETDERRLMLGEARLRLNLEKHIRPAEMSIIASVDVLDDHVVHEHEPDLQRGDGAIDLRQLYFSMKPVSFATLRMGRQIATWGTGDLVFINDNFPKDFRSFVIGRDLDYLKAPIDAARLDLRVWRLQITGLYAPQLDTDRFITGERVVYWNGFAPSAASEPPLDPVIPDRLFADDEATLRINTVVRRYELSLYGYSGFTKSPLAVDAESGRPTFSKLAVTGLSVRGPVPFGLAWVEAAANLSRDDRDGDDPLVPNSELRGLAGYELSLGEAVTLSAQVLVERMLHYRAYLNGLPDGAARRDRNRVLTTTRLNIDLDRRELRLSLFSFFSPTDRDGHLRLAVAKGIAESLEVVGGMNLFYGRDKHTAFGQFSENSSIFVGARYAL